MGLIITVTSILTVLKLVEVALSDRSSIINEHFEPESVAVAVAVYEDPISPKKILVNHGTEDILRKAVVLEQALCKTRENKQIYSNTSEYLMEANGESKMFKKHCVTLSEARLNKHQSFVQVVKREFVL